MTEKRVHLREMTDKEYASFILYSSEHQAACLKKEKGISEEEAYVETKEELNKMLPNGKNTPGNYFMAICTRDDSVVGNMWYMHDTRREDTYLFLCDFHILQKERRKGYGKEALSEMEEVARQLSCKRCVLFVKNENIGARILYEKCGYIYRNERENGVYMDKEDLDNMDSLFYEGVVIRWEGAFAESKRNNIERLAMSFGTPDIDMVGGIEAFQTLIEGFHRTYCPNMIFEPELTFVSSCDAALEAEKLDQYAHSGYFKSIDVCGGENVQPFEAFLPLYRKAEDYHMTKKMHVGETGFAEDVRRAVEVLGLSEIHHGINAYTSKDTMRFLADNHIQLNVCPSSNVMLGYVKDYKNHPIKTLVENGVTVTINTDDLLIFDSSIENEYLLLYCQGVLSAEQLDEIRRNGLRK